MSTWRTVTSREPCRICGKPDWCAISQDGNWSICRRIETADAIHRTDSSGADFYLYGSGTSDSSSPPPLPSISPDPLRAPPEVLDEAYRTLLGKLELSAGHRKNLSDRGLSGELIDQLGYRTMPTKRRKELGSWLADQIGTETAGTIPGLNLKTGPAGGYWSLGGDPGLIIPCQDVKGRIVALKVRLDIVKGSGPRYRYVSGKPHGGPSPGAPVHLPKGMIAASFLTIRVTEGELKADIASYLSGTPTISVPGVSSWRALLPVLKDLGTKTVLLACDTDYHTNRIVAQALHHAASSLLAAGYTVELETWDPEIAKGIDDLLSGGGSPSIVRGAGVLSTIAGALESLRQQGPTSADSALDSAVEFVDRLPKLAKEDPGAPFEAAALPAIALVRSKAPATWARVRGGLKAAGVSLRDLDRVVADLVEPAAEKRAEKPAREHTQPVINISGRYMREISDDGIRALRAIDEHGPLLFSRGGAAVRLIDDGDEVYAQPLNLSSLKGLLDRHADFVKQEKGEEKPARPPDDVVQDILSLQVLPFPDLRAIAKTPVVLDSGRMLTGSGYDPESGYYLNLNGLSNVKGNMPPDEALGLILEDVLVDFPFVDPSSKAHALALLIQAFIIPAINGPCPMYLIEAPTPATGKGLLAEVAYTIATGRGAGVMQQPTDEDETRKRILSLLMQGHNMILLDNVYRLRSGVLSSALTSTWFVDRLLGSSRMVRVRQAATWLATGNNVELSDEMARRCVLIRMDSEEEHPEQRTQFKHPELVQWIRGRRPDLVAACLSIVNAWIAEGQPKSQGLSLGSFERWAATMGGILEVAGVPGFLGNRGEMHSQADTTTEEWGLLCSVWYEKYGGRVVTAHDVYGVARENDLLLDLWAGRAMLGGQQRFGHALAGKRDRVFGPFRITRAGKDRRTRSQGWMLALIREAANRPEKNPRKPPQTPANLRPADPRDAGKPVQTSLLASGESPSKTPAAPGEPGVGEDSGVSGVISESDEEKEND